MSSPPAVAPTRSAATSPQSPRSPQNPPDTVPSAAIQAESDDNGSEEVDVEDDTDSTYGTEASSYYSASITSSIRNNIHENGLRYHAFKQDVYYPFPNDENEQNRDDIKHAMTLMVCGGKLHYAPIGDNPQMILDLGTGTGIWAIEMAEKYPSAVVEGLDLSAIQPLYVPPNLKFIIDDIEEEWVYQPNFFDYIHCRHVAQAIRNKPRLLQRAFRTLKPGGYCEFQEIYYYPHCDDGTMRDPYPVKDWWDELNKGIANLGGDNTGASKLAGQMRDAGFVNVEEIVLKIPLGVWPKDKLLKQIGLFWRVALSDGLINISTRAFTRGLGWSLEALYAYLVDVRKSLHDTTSHVYNPLYIVVGQKPERD